MTVADRIKQRRVELDMTQDELAKKLGYTSRSSINKIEKNAQNLPQSKINAIAKILNVTPSYLMGWEDKDGLPLHDKPASGVKIPVLGDVAAGIPIDAIEDVLDWEEISVQLAVTGEFFCLRVHGDSMEPRICEGDVLVVRQQPDAESGQIVIVRIDHEIATCKRLKKYADGSIALISTNPQYEPMYFDKEAIENEPVEILGVVVENRQKY